MPACEHKDAVCVVGDFWTCKTPGCKNGPSAGTGDEIEFRVRYWGNVSTPYQGVIEWADDEKTPTVAMWDLGDEP